MTKLTKAQLVSLHVVALFAGEGAGPIELANTAGEGLAVSVDGQFTAYVDRTGRIARPPARRVDVGPADDLARGDGLGADPDLHPHSSPITQRKESQPWD